MQLAGQPDEVLWRSIRGKRAIGTCRDDEHAERVSAALARLGFHVATIGNEVVTPGWSDDSIHAAERIKGHFLAPDTLHKLGLGTERCWNRSGPIRTALYRACDAAGVLLYTGITQVPRVRFVQHAKTKPWWNQVSAETIDVTWYRTRPDARIAERTAIHTEKPRHDKMP